MAYGDPNDFGWCNIAVKFLLFVTNFIVWVSFDVHSIYSVADRVFCRWALIAGVSWVQLLGVALLGAGVYVLTAPETNLDNLDADNFLTAPAVLLCIIGGLLFILGFCGCFGALLELYIPLIVVG